MNWMDGWVTTWRLPWGGPRKRATIKPPPEPCEHRFVRAVVGEDFARCAKCKAVTNVRVDWGTARRTVEPVNPLPPPNPPDRGSAGFRHRPLELLPPVTMDELEDAPPEVLRAFPKHFTYREMTFSEYAARKGIPNDPPNDVLLRLLQTAMHMEALREALRDSPIHVTSGFRSVGVNSLVGGSKNSAHCLGYAVDFQCPAFGSPLKVAHALSMLDLMGDVDQLIHEHGAWVHISFDPRKRGMLLTIDKYGTREGLLPCR